jgi:hypothetical protein
VLVVLGLMALLALGGCGGAPPTASPGRPAVQIDPSWTSADGRWTFTGRVDPAGQPTSVILEIGPGPETARRFDTQQPVAGDLTTAGPLMITTRDIPDNAEVCVRFTATNDAGRSSSQPLCIAPEAPSIVPAGPTVRIDRDWTAANGEWTFTGRVDPGGAPTNVVLEIGRGPETAAQYDNQVSVARNLAELATLDVTTREFPDIDEVCVRFTATNNLGTASSSPLCFEADAGGGSAEN